ncbi:MAG: hypothetical protein LT106_18675 [Burkholderiaceae bacterium]|nr:hypothetical protein [Burkholderiaceae bacterium]
MSRYNDAARGAPEPEVDSGRCHAYGCPLPGAISDSTKGSGPWLCRFHFGRDRGEWQAITETVRLTMRDREQGDFLPDASRAPAHFTEPA